MVTPIKYFKRDPNELERGAGVYYHRGKGYFSKYSRTHDAKIKSTGWKVDVIGLPKATRYPQISDGVIHRGVKKKQKKR